MRDTREKWARVRIRAVGAVFILMLAVTVSRAFYLQVLRNDDWIKLADRQHQKTIPLTPARGTIFDRNGAALAESVEMDSCYGEPKNMADLGLAATALAGALELPRAELARKLAGNRNFVWLRRLLPPEVAVRVRKLGLPGVGFVKETRRFYPNSEVAAHVIGFTGLDPEGLEGVERYYNTTMLGNTGYLVTERDALGRDIALKGTITKSSSRGLNLVLTLDKNIQYIAEKELAKTVQENGASAGTAMVMESATGRILAMANYPTFNPNAARSFPHAALRNRAIADSFEPGSTFKVFLIAAALEEKVISPGEYFNCEFGSYAIGGRVIHDTHKYGSLSVPDILKYSSNIGAAKIGARLGKERLNRGLRNFGFGQRTGIDLPGEALGQLRDVNRWYPIDLATVSFGQGVSASAIQLITAVSAVANGGTLMRPYLVEKVVDAGGTVIQQVSPHPVRRVVSAQTARAVSKMMEGVTNEGGTGMKASLEGYTVAGKTGTAQKVDPVTHRYSAKRIGSFIGFVPADRPKLTILVVVDEPRTSSYGGIVAAPAFSAIAHQSLCYLRVPPSGGGNKPPVVVAKVPTAAEEEQAAAEGAVADESNAAAMPSFLGMSIRQALQIMEKRGLNVKLIGSGRAVEQSPPPGGVIGPSDQVWIRFQPSA